MVRWALRHIYREEEDELLEYQEEGGYYVYNVWDIVRDSLYDWCNGEAVRLGEGEDMIFIYGNKIVGAEQIYGRQKFEEQFEQLSEAIIS